MFPIQDADKTIRLSEKRLKPSLIELKTLKCPPQSVKTVLEVLCIILNVSPGVKPDVTNPGKFIQDYWVSCRKLLNNPNKLTALILNLDKFNLSKSKLNLIKKYLRIDPDLEYNQVKKVSVAAATIFAWIQGVYGYGTAMTYLGAEHPSYLEQQNGENKDVCVEHRGNKPETVSSKRSGIGMSTVKTGENGEVMNKSKQTRPRTVPANIYSRSTRNHTSIGGVYDYFYTSKDLGKKLSKEKIIIPLKNMPKFTRTKSYVAFKNFRF